MQVNFRHRFVCIRRTLVSLSKECFGPADFEIWVILETRNVA
jgi:hypothetical protein